jgi:hypothetical protein
VSISLCGRIKDSVVDSNTLEKHLREYYGVIRKLSKDDGEEVSYELNSDYGRFVVYYVEKKKPPYNVYDSDLVGGEFVFSQLVVFDLDKEEVCKTTYEDLVSFFIYLQKKIESEILVTSDVHDEICLLKKEGCLYTEQFQDLCKPR